MIEAKIYGSKRVKRMLSLLPLMVERVGVLIIVGCVFVITVEGISPHCAK